MSGIEGVTGAKWYAIGEKLGIPASILQLMGSVEAQTIPDITKTVMNEVFSCSIDQDMFYVIGYSYGTIIAMEVAKILEKSGRCGHVLLIDGAPAYLKRLTLGIVKTSSDASANNDDFESALIMVMLRKFAKDVSADVILPKLNSCENFIAKLEVAWEAAPEVLKAKYSKKYVETLLIAKLNRLKALLKIEIDGKNNIDENDKIKSPILLVRPTTVSISDITDDYQLSDFASGPITVKYINGNHVTMLDNDELIDMINEFCP